MSESTSTQDNLQEEYYWTKEANQRQPGFECKGCGDSFYGLFIKCPHCGYNILPKVTAYGESHVGLAKDTQEDRFFLSEPASPSLERGYLYLVADGVSGFAHGAEASARVIKEISNFYYQDNWSRLGLNPPRALRQALLSANRAIFESLTRVGEAKGASASTISAMVILGNWAIIAHIGDSRAYLLRDGHLKALTVDHTWLEETGRTLIRQGFITEAELETDKRRHIITQSLGAKPAIQPSLKMVEIRPGDRLLLCSDGLWQMLKPAELRQLLTNNESSQACTQNMLETVIKRTPALDNLTALVVDIHGLGCQLKPATTRKWSNLISYLEDEQPGYTSEIFLRLNTLEETTSPNIFVEEAPSQLSVVSLPQFEEEYLDLSGDFAPISADELSTGPDPNPDSSPASEEPVKEPNSKTFPELNRLPSPELLKAGPLLWRKRWVGVALAVIFLLIILSWQFLS